VKCLSPFIKERWIGRITEEFSLAFIPAEIL